MSLLNSTLLRVSPFALLLGLFAASPAAAQEGRQADGIFVTVDNPINEGRINQIKAQIDRARNDPGRNIKKVVFDFNPEGKDAATEAFGSCYELADTSSR